MRWRGRRASSNVEDQRGGGGRRPAKMAIGGGLGLVILIVGTLMGVDVQGLLGGGQGMSAQTHSSQTKPGLNDEQKQFVSVILADTEQTWTRLFKKMGRRYVQPKLVLFEEKVASACGFQSAAVGPFYCPGDQKAYLDLSFFRDLDQRFKAPGDFARAYVIAHEIGHHIQNLLGTSTKVHKEQRGLSKAEVNKLGVRLELQADCYAGVWAHAAHTRRKMLEAGDLEEGLNAASAIGDDTLQKRAGGRVQPESWTHGSSKQRVKWFRKGFNSGDPEDCDTFSVRTP